VCDIVFLYAEILFNINIVFSCNIDGMHDVTSRPISQSPTVYQKTNNKYQTDSSTTTIYSQNISTASNTALWRDAETGLTTTSIRSHPKSNKKPRKQTGLVSKVAFIHSLCKLGVTFSLCFS